ATEAEQQLGIDYIVGDGRNLGLAADYDLAVAAYFLNYAHDRAELSAMCSGVARYSEPARDIVENLGDVFAKSGHVAAASRTGAAAVVLWFVHGLLTRQMVW